MINSFSISVKNLWIHDTICRLCGKRMASDLHHIYGRGGTKRNQFMNSAYNASPLCRPCHEMGEIHQQEVRDILIKDTAQFLKKQGYKKTKKDELFLNYI